MEVDWDKIAARKLEMLEREYQECIAAEIQIKDANTYKGLKASLDEGDLEDFKEDDEFGEFQQYEKLDSDNSD